MSSSTPDGHLFRILADNIPALAWMANADGYITWYNRRWHEYCGTTPEQMEGWGWQSVHDPEMLPTVLERWAVSIATGQTFEMTFPLRGADGAFRPFLTRVEPYRDEAGRVVRWFGTNADVSTQMTAEKQVRESEARLRALTDNLPGGMVYQIWTGPGGEGRRFLYASQSHEKLTGIPADAVTADASVAYNLILPEDREKLAQAEAEALRDRGIFDVEARFRRADGELRWCRIISAPREQDDGSTIWDGIQIDITSQKQADAAVRESEERLRIVQQAGGIGTFDYDLKKDDAICSPEYYEMFGLPLGHPINSKVWPERIHPDDRELAVEALRSSARERRPFDYEYRITRADTGEVRWLSGRAAILLDEEGNPSRYVGGNIDITDRKRTEEALRESEEFNRRILDSSSDCIKVLSLDGRLESMSPGGMRVLEVDDFSAIEGHYWPDFWAGDKHAAAVEALEEARNGRTGRFQGLAPTLKGKLKWWDVAVTPIVGGDGTTEKLLSISRDVSDQKQAEEALRDLNETLEQRVQERTEELMQAQEALRQSQKLEAMGQLTGGVAHDFNNLLAPIIGGLDMLQRRGLGGDREQRILDGALQSAERAKTLVQRLLAFARRQPLQASAVDVAGLVRGMADLVASTSGPQIKVVVDLPPGLPPAKADSNQMEMAILNLSVNARDAMPDGGTLTISAAARALAAGEQPRLEPGHYVRLAVSDTGVGMDEATLARAVEPFFSTKGVGKGTGLGLSMVHGLASQLGGALLMSSKPGLGTSVELWLPVSEEAPERDGGSEAQPGGRVGAGTVLLVDDEALVRASTADMLQELGYTVVEAESGKEALSLIEARVPDLVVTDHLMPGLSGTELAQIIRSRRAGVPVLVISGYAHLEGISPELPRLSKPFRQADLAAGISEAMEKAGAAS